MFTIYIRNNGYNHEFKTESVYDAHVLFNVLTKTFLHVEMWKGIELIIKYDNSSRAIDEEYDEFGVNTKNSFNTAP